MGFRSRKSRKSRKKKNKTKRGGTLQWNMARRRIVPEHMNLNTSMGLAEDAEASVLNLIFAPGNPFGAYWVLNNPNGSQGDRVEINMAFWLALNANLTLGVSAAT